MGGMKWDMKGIQNGNEEKCWEGEYKNESEKIWCPFSWFSWERGVGRTEALFVGCGNVVSLVSAESERGMAKVCSARVLPRAWANCSSNSFFRLLCSLLTKQKRLSGRPVNITKRERPPTRSPCQGRQGRLCGFDLLLRNACCLPLWQSWKMLLFVGQRRWLQKRRRWSRVRVCHNWQKREGGNPNKKWKAQSRTGQPATSIDPAVWWTEREECEKCLTCSEEIKK